MTKNFRIAYVTEASSHSFLPVLEECEEIRFITTGYETDGDLPDIIASALEDYHPDIDVILPVGRVATNLIVGIVAERKKIETRSNCINIAFYRDRKYVIHSVTEFGIKNVTE